MQAGIPPIKRRKYDATFKKEVLNMVASGRPVSEVSQALGIGENLIYKWRSRSASGNLPSAPLAADSVDLVSRNQELLALLRKAEEERDILKKALLIFSRQT
jgi:transposase